MFIHIDWGGTEMLSILWSYLYRGFLDPLSTFPLERLSTTRLARRIINAAVRIPKTYLFVQSMFSIHVVLISNNKPYLEYIGSTNSSLFNSDWSQPNECGIISEGGSSISGMSMQAWLRTSAMSCVPCLASVIPMVHTHSTGTNVMDRSRGSHRTKTVPAARVFGISSRLLVDR